MNYSSQVQKAVGKQCGNSGECKTVGNSPTPEEVNAQIMVKVKY